MATITGGPSSATSVLHCDDGCEAREWDTVAVTGTDGAGVWFDAYPFMIATLIVKDAETGMQFMKGWPDGERDRELHGKHWFRLDRIERVSLVSRDE